MQNRIQTWLALIVLAVGVVLAAVLGLYLYVSATAEPLHPNPQGVPSVAHLAPSREWAGAVEQGRRIVREGLIEQNLPGLSVAVGVNGEIVWAEGLGWASIENRLAGMDRTSTTTSTPASLSSRTKISAWCRLWPMV